MCKLAEMASARHNATMSTNTRQQSIPKFTETERKLVQTAMKIECIRSQGMWVHRAALLHARRVVVEDAGNTAIVDSAMRDAKDLPVDEEST